MSKKYRLAIFAILVIGMVAIFSSSASAQYRYNHRGPYAGPGFYHSYYGGGFDDYYGRSAVDIQVGRIGVHVSPRPAYHRETVFVTPAPPVRRTVIIQPAPVREKVIVRRGVRRW